MEHAMTDAGLCVLTAGLGVLTVEDIRRRELSGIWILLLATAGAVFSVLAGSWTQASDMLRFLPGGFVLLLAWLTREGIGYGDGFVILSLGCFYTMQQIAAVCMLAVTAAGLAALFLLVVFHKGRKAQIPFVPFLLAAHLLYWGMEAAG